MDRGLDSGVPWSQYPHLIGEGYGWSVIRHCVFIDGSGRFLARHNLIFNGPFFGVQIRSHCFGKTNESAPQPPKNIRGIVAMLAARQCTGLRLGSTAFL